METALFTTLGVLFVILGFIGTVLPLLPGAPLAWVGILLFKYSGHAQYDWWLVWLLLPFVILGIVMDYVIPSWGTKKMGGSKMGVRGTFIGLFVGIIFAPFGGFSIIVCPFLGAFIGEILHDNQDYNRALKAAFGSFLGFLTTTGYGIILCCVMLGCIIYSGINGGFTPIIESIKSWF